MVETQAMPKAIEWECTNEEYHSDSEFVSNSSKELFRKKRLKYHAVHVAKSMRTDSPTEDMLIGTYAHVAVLEEDRFDCEFAIKPDVDGRTSKGKMIKREFAEANVGKTIIDAESHRLVLSLRDALYAHSIARKLLWGEGLREHTITWLDPDTGIACKSRRDSVNPRLLVDLKTCADVSGEAFARTIMQRGYDRQAAFYRRGELAFSGEWKPFLFVAVSKPLPHEVAVYEIGLEDILRADDENKKTLSELASCRVSDDWTPGYQKRINLISLPRYAYNKDYES